MKKYAACTAFLIFALTAPRLTWAQNSSTPAAKIGSVRASDVDTLDHIIVAIYDVISGQAGPRNWDRFHSLFYPGARFIPVKSTPEGVLGAKEYSADEFAQNAQAYFDKQGFYENAAANRIEQWGHIAHVWSTYESRHAKDEKPFARGINSIQLLNDGKRWWVLTIYWEDESAGNPLPKKYLKK